MRAPNPARLPYRPRWLIPFERWTAKRPRLAPLTRELARRRLNGVAADLLVAIYFQSAAGSLRMVVTRHAFGESDDAWRARMASERAVHAVAALQTIQLMVYNDLKQRGLLHAIGLEEPPR